MLPFSKLVVVVDRIFGFGRVAYIRPISNNYGHENFSIRLLRDTTPRIEIQLMIYGATHPFLWNHARFFHQIRPMRAQK